MSDPREAAEKAIRNRQLIEELDRAEAERRRQIQPTKTQPKTTPPPTPTTTFTPSTSGSGQGKQPSNTPPSQRIPQHKFEDIIQTFYEKSNYPSKQEVTKAIQSQGQAAVQQFKPKNLSEATYRALYGFTEPIGGWIQEATLGLSGDFGRGKRGPKATVLAITGAVVGPSTALDYAVGAAISRVAITNKKIAGKVYDYFFPENMWANKQIAAKSIRAFESISPKKGFSTTDLRNIKKVVKSLDLESAKPWISPGEFQTLKRLSTLSDEADVRKLEKFLLTEPEKNLRYADLHPTSNWNVFRVTAKKLTSKLDTSDVPLDRVLTPNEYKIWKKQFSNEGLNWDELRNLKKDELKKLVEANVKWVEKNKSASRLTSVMELEKENIRALNWDVDEYVNYLKNKPVSNLTPKLIASLLVNVPAEDARKIIKKTTSLSETQIDDTIEIMRESVKQFPRKATHDGTGEETTPTQEQEPDVTPTPTPTPTPQKQRTRQRTPTEPTPEPTKTSTPTLPKLTYDPSPISKTKLLEFTLPNYELFRVEMILKSGRREDRTPRAKSFPEAYGAAKHSRRLPGPLRTVTIRRIAK